MARPSCGLTYCHCWKTETSSHWSDTTRYRLDALTAKDAEREALDRIRHETLPRGATTTAELWAAYRVHLGERPHATALLYSGKAVLPHFGALRPDQITVDHCRDYARRRAAVGISTGSVWTELGHLRSCVCWAAKIGLIERAPYVELPQKPAPRDRYLSLAEINRLLAADCAPHIRLAILLMLTTAGRVSAIPQLT